MEATTKTLTEAAKAIAEAEAHGDTDARSDAIAALAQALAADDEFVGNLVGHLEDDLDRATTIIWEDGYHLAKELVKQARTPS